MSNTTPEMSTPRAASWRTTYLTAYNTLQTSLWFILLTLTLSALSLGPDFIYTQIGPFARWVQTLCLLDIAHAATGLIPSPLGTTFTQVATRVIQVWLIWWGFPEAVLGSASGGVAFVALVLAWSLADGVRYAFLVVKMVYGSAGETLTWLRYSLFYVLYPIGIAAEWWLMYRAVGPVGEVSPLLPPVFYFLLALYVPGAYYMFSHMVGQRKKVLAKSKGKES